MIAFKCDRCREYKDGRPKGTVTFTTDDDAETTIELCKQCYDVVRTEATRTPAKQALPPLHHA